MNILYNWYIKHSSLSRNLSITLFTPATVFNSAMLILWNNRFALLMILSSTVLVVFVSENERFLIRLSTLEAILSIAYKISLLVFTENFTL